MLNDLFKKYQSHSFRGIDIDRHHKKRLRDSLFKTGKTKIPFWTWSKAIFTAPVVALIAIVFVLSSNKTLIQHTLLPQDALAQAIQNTFNLDSFETTFGLPDDGKFYHRVMTYHSNETENPNGPFAEMTHLWTDGKNMRRDVSLLHDNDTYHNFYSFLVNHQENINCSFVLFKECQPLSTFNQDQITWFLEGGTPYKPVKSEELISDLSITPFYDGPKGPMYLLKWSTDEPMKFAEIITGYDPMGGAVGLIDDPAIVSKPDEYGFVNMLDGQKYWHGTTLALETKFIAKKQYFQIKNHVPLDARDPRQVAGGQIQNVPEKSSMIYAIDRNGTVGSLAPDEFVEDMKRYNASTDVDKDLFQMGFQSAIFSLKKEKFARPIDIQSLEKEGEKLIKYRYLLSNDYYDPFIPVYPKEDYFVDLYINETQTKFRGYVMVKDETELESLWIQDETLSDAKKTDLFDQAAWEASIADEYKGKELERKKVLEDIEYQKATGEVRIHIEE